MELIGQSAKHVVVMVAFGAGVLVGFGASWWYVSHHMTRVTCSLQETRQEVNEINFKIDRLQQCVHQLLQLKQLGSTDEDEDIYEDAYDGPVSWVGGLCSEQVASYVSNDVASESSMLSFFSDIDRLLDGNDSDKRNAFQLLNCRQFQMKSDANFMWRMSKATYFMSQFEAAVDKNTQKESVYQALNYATCALRLDDNNPDVHKWYAITLGSIGDYENITVKIRNGFDFKTHIEKAIQLNPKDPTAHYLLGRWCFGVYMLSWVERKMASTLFAVPPTATIDEALEHFLQANSLSPGNWKENMLFVAKCYIQKRGYAHAIEWLGKAQQVPVRGHEDEAHHKEIISLLHQYSGYCH